MEVKYFTWRRSTRCFTVTSALQLLSISVLILLAMPNPIVALRPQYVSISQLPHHQDMTSSFNEFVKTSGHQFSLGGKALYVNGANIYWLMSMATDVASRAAVTEVLTEAAGVGVTLVRTWAFSDGTDYHPLQVTPGVFDESVFQVICNESIQLKFGLELY